MGSILTRLLPTKSLWIVIATLLAAAAAAFKDTLPGDWGGFFALLLGELHFLAHRDTKAKEQSMLVTTRFAGTASGVWTTPLGQWLMEFLRTKFNSTTLSTVLAVATPILEQFGAEAKLNDLSQNVKRELWARVQGALRKVGIAPQVSLPVKSILFLLLITSLFTLSSCVPLASYVFPDSPEPTRVETYLVDNIASLDGLTLKSPVVDGADSGALVYAAGDALYGVEVVIEGDNVKTYDEVDRCEQTLFGGGTWCELSNIPKDTYAFVEMNCDACSIRVVYRLVEGGEQYSRFITAEDILIN